MKVQNSEREKKLLFVVGSAIVYQNIAFSHSLALQAMRYRAPEAWAFDRFRLWRS
jgi:hypothetical protein